MHETCSLTTRLHKNKKIANGHTDEIAPLDLFKRINVLLVYDPAAWRQSRRYWPQLLQGIWLKTAGHLLLKWVFGLHNNALSSYVVCAYVNITCDLLPRSFYLVHRRRIYKASSIRKTEVIRGEFWVHIRDILYQMSGDLIHFLLSFKW